MVGNAELFWGRPRHSHKEHEEHQGNDGKNKVGAHEWAVRPMAPHFVQFMSA